MYCLNTILCIIIIIIINFAGVLAHIVSGCWNRGFSLYTEVHSFQRVGSNFRGWANGISTVYRGAFISEGGMHFRGWANGISTVYKGALISLFYPLK